MVFVRKSLVKEIKNLDAIIVKTGMLGMAGNKGSCIIRFQLFKTTFAFSNGHYASGEECNEERIKELTEIMTKNLKEVGGYGSSYRENRIIDHEVAFIFGDLNFRLDIENGKCRSLIKSNQLDLLLQQDQFLKERKRNQNFKMLEEGQITFNPTFKFDFMSQEYDTSKKKRVPSWTDRILWKKSHLIKQTSYDSIPQMTQSDHRPVYGLFKIAVSKNGKLDVDSLKNTKESKSTEKNMRAKLDIAQLDRQIAKSPQKNNDSQFKNPNKLDYKDDMYSTEKHKHNIFQLQNLNLNDNQDGYFGQVVNNMNTATSKIIFILYR